MITENCNNNTVFLNTFLLFNCLIACKHAPEVYPTNTPSFFAISLD